MSGTQIKHKRIPLSSKDLVKCSMDCRKVLAQNTLYMLPTLRKSLWLLFCIITGQDEKVCQVVELAGGSWKL